jgi:hypothetical protein
MNLQNQIELLQEDTRGRGRDRGHRGGRYSWHQNWRQILQIRQVLLKVLSIAIIVARVIIMKKSVILNKDMRLNRNRGRGHHRGRSRGGRHQSHFVESSTVVPQEPTTNYLFMASHIDIFTSQCVWYIDLGATKHMIGKQEVFSKFAPCDNEIIILGDDNIHEVQGRGEVPMRVSRDCIKNIQNVLYVHGLKTNLLSISKIIDENYTVVFDKKQCLIKDHNNIIARGLWCNDMYRFDGIPKQQ